MKIGKISIALAIALASMTACGNKQESTESETIETSTAADYDGVDSIAAPQSDATPAEEEVSEAAPAASNDWDKVLDEYEDYSNKVSSLSKKVMAGDMSAMTEYTSLLEKAESLSNKLEKAEDEMTTAQVARLNKIAQKMAQSMM
ncbi:MAG: hypothetical protein K2F75_00515 [Paramuribaculum sp.]|nr:hypothetical protein [Paramuribaculum sp.]